mmetsp:Transcript_62214/g.196891  ORF Transcript_62214/g.196891 Transcript_62214/m.196891 type:complete len:213 (-) Transcript_62214:33-671(-)
MSPRTPCGACCRPSVCHHRVGGSLFLTPPRGGKQREDYNISNLKMAIGLGKWKARMKSNMDKPAAPATGKYGPSSDDRIKSMASSKRATRHEVPSVYAAVWERDINRTPRRDTTKDLKVINKHYLQKTPLPRTAQITSMDAWFNEYGEPKGLSLRAGAELGQLAESHSMPSLFGGRSTPSLKGLSPARQKRVAGMLPRGRWTPEPGKGTLKF